MQLSAKLTERVDCYVSLPRVFQRFTTSSFSQGTLCQVIQATLIKSQKVFYFGSQGISNDNIIEIGYQFAQLLNIEEDDHLQIATIPNCNQSSAITLFVQKWSDYMIIQHQRDKFETALLNSIQIVFHDIVFPVYYQEGQYVTFTFKASDYKGPIAISSNCELNILIEEAQKPEQKLQQIQLTVLFTKNQHFESFIEINTELYHQNRLDKLHQITYTSHFPKCYRNFNKFIKHIKQNKQKANVPKNSIVQFKSNNEINNKYCFISSVYAKFLGIKEGQAILINTQEHDICKEAQIRQFKRSQLLNQKIYFYIYSDYHVNKEAFIKMILEKIEKHQQTVISSRVHLIYDHFYYIRILQIIPNQPEHFITTLSIINEHNEPKILGERERALLTKYLEDNVKVFPFTAAIQKEIKFYQYQQFKTKKSDTDFGLFLSLFENSVVQISKIMNQEIHNQCLVVCKENQVNQILNQFLQTKYDVLKLNIDKLNQQGSNEKLSNVKKYIKHIFWQARQVSISDTLILIKGVDSIKSTDLIDFQQSFIILISNILSKLIRNQIKEYPGIKLVILIPSKEYLNGTLQKIFTKEQIIEFNKPKQDVRQNIFQQFYQSNQIKQNSQMLAQRSENFNYTQFNALQTREKYQQELNQPITEEWVLQQIDDLQDHQIQLTNKIPTFKEIGGLKAQKEIILDLFDLPMKYEHLFAKTKIKLPKSVLIYGMPGCGKTYFSLSICNELKINVLTVKGPELLDKYIGSSEQNVRDLFFKAQSLAPCIIFLDEIDSVVPVRTSSHSGVTDRVVNQFLCYLDGVEEGMKGVYIVAASSRPDLIDPALLRPGRIDKHVRIDLPNEEEILEILRIYKGPLQFDGITEEEIVSKLIGLSQADVVSFFKETRIYLTDKIVQLDDFSIRKKVANIEDIKLTKELFHEIMKTMKPSLSQKQINFYQDVFNRFEKGGVKDMKQQKQALQ